MGLDMYLRSKIYIGANYEHNKIAGVIYLTKEGKPIKINLDKVTYIIEDCGYWRKSNQIHGWFVDNVQKGTDDCGEYYVSEDKLKELLNLCLQIKANPTLASELLPTRSGFFFGNEEYDEYYWEDIDNTIEILNNVLNDTVEINGKKFLRGEIYYSSSW
jgi:ABC-type Zn uptake system ZnuABC Zn-binding protein ZnuA